MLILVSPGARLAWDHPPPPPPVPSQAGRHSHERAPRAGGGGVR